MKDTYFYIYWKLSPQFLTTKPLHMLRSVVLIWKTRISIFYIEFKIYFKSFPVGLLKNLERAYFIYIKCSFCSFTITLY